MPMMKVGIRFFTLILFILSGCCIVSAQESAVPDTFNITSHAMQFPHQYKKWGFQVSAGLSMVRPPKDLLENAIQAPLVNIHSTFGLPWKFSLEGDITTLIVSNQFMLGPRLSFLIKNFGIKAGWDLAFVYGQMKQGEFNNSTQAWIHYPNLSLGYKLKKMAFTFKTELVTISRVSTKSGENEVTSRKNFLDGATAAIYIEQRIHKNNVLVIGIKDNYLKYYWPTWMLFTTFNRYYHIPELSFSWIL
jgi:hypothetical protein